MPKVTKQAARKRGARPIDRTALKTDVADRIRSVKDIRHGVKILVYGRGKTGKTRFASTFPKDVLFISTVEDGTLSVQNVDGVDAVEISSTAEYYDLLQLLRQGAYRTGVLDTGGGLQDIVLKEVLGLNEIPLQKTWGIAKRQQWGAVVAQCKRALKEMLDLSKGGKTNVVIIAHERDFTEKDEDGNPVQSSDDLDLLVPKIGAALTPGLTEWLNGNVEYICQTFIQDKYEEVQATENTTYRQKTGEYEYCLRTGPHDLFITGFRVPVGSNVPSFVSDPSYEGILPIIQGRA